MAILLSTGFSNWKKFEFTAFIEAFNELELDDVKGIAERIETKTEPEILQYLCTFKQRFFELKVRD